MKQQDGELTEKEKQIVREAYEKGFGYNSIASTYRLRSWKILSFLKKEGLLRDKKVSFDARLKATGGKWYERESA